MRNIFDRGHFQEYSIEERYFSAVEGRSRILLEGQERTTKTKVFLSHKHDDLEDLKGLIGFLEKEYRPKFVETFPNFIKSFMKKYGLKTPLELKDFLI